MQCNSLGALVARVVFSAFFAMAAVMKISDPLVTTDTIEAAGFPMPALLTWFAVIFEFAVAAAIFSGIAYQAAKLGRLLTWLFSPLCFTVRTVGRAIRSSLRSSSTMSPCLPAWFWPLAMTPENSPSIAHGTEEVGVFSPQKGAFADFAQALDGGHAISLLRSYEAAAARSGS